MPDGRMPQTGGVYRTHHHLDETVALFGPFLPRLLARADQGLVGRVRESVTHPYAQLENWIEGLTGEDRNEFVSLLQAMTVTDPEERKTPIQLLDHVWLQH